MIPERRQSSQEIGNYPGLKNRKKIGKKQIFLMIQSNLHFVQTNIELCRLEFIEKFLGCNMIKLHQSKLSSLY